MINDDAKLCHKISKDIPMKKLLYYNLTIAKSFELDEQIFKLLSKFSDVKAFVNLNEKEIMKFLFFNKNKIKNILFNEEEIVNIKINKNKKEFPYYFYLSLLLQENCSLINYVFPIDIITELFHIIEEQIKNNNNNVLQNLLMSKVIVELVNNYKLFDEYNEEKEKAELENIEKSNRLYIQNNLQIFQKFDINFDVDVFILKPIDKIYISIIISLIKNKKLENYDNIYMIFNQLDLESIQLTKKMFNEISDELNSNKDYINYYSINELDDLFVNKKIDFYFILLKYILKDSFYIYNIPFLLKAREKIIKLLKSNINDIASFYNFNENFKERFEYILMKLTDSEYYYKKFSEKIKNIKLTKNGIEQHDSIIEKYCDNNELVIKDRQLENEDLKVLEKPKYEFLQKIHLFNNSLESIDSLETTNVKNVEVFILAKNDISSINALAKINFTKLKELNLANNKIKDISPLANIKFDNLEILDLNHNEIEILSKFGKNKLKKLNLYNNKIKDISPLKESNLEELEILNLNSNQISDLSELQYINFKNLKELYLYNNNINNVEILGNKNMSNLEVINLNTNNISNLDKLQNANITELKELYISYNKIKEIKFLEKVNFPKLEILSLQNQQKDSKIEDISILEKVNFKMLKELYLSHNNICFIDMLQKAKFENLEILKLNSNNIKSISLLNKADFPELKELYLNNNQISNIDVFESCKFNKLEILNLKNNLIQNISVFEKILINKLKKFFIFNNDIKCLNEGFNTYYQLNLLFQINGFPKIFQLKKLNLHQEKAEIDKRKFKLIIKYLNLHIRNFFI